jgi:IgGFc binding protein
MACAFASLGQPQADSVVAVVANAQGLPFVAPQDRPPFGNYWEVRNSLSCIGPPMPCPPIDPNTPVYAVGGDLFLADETAGPLVDPVPKSYRNRTLTPADYAAIVQAQANELQNFIAQLQAQLLSAQSGPNRTMSALDTDIPPLPGDAGGGSGTNDWPNDATPTGKQLGTNDLWLEILSMSLSNATAHLVIHPPWNVTNGLYDLLYCTNLAPPISWQWLLRTDPGQTNLPAVYAPSPQSFYRLGLPNDLTATSSLGTNFWLAFFHIYPFYGPNLSLYISSPVGAAGTVTIPGLGITNAFSVAAGAVTNISLDPSVMMAGYDVVETNGIHVTATQPVSVVALDYDPWNSAAFNCFPATLLGTNYCVLARASSEMSYDGCYSQFAIVATADNTTVTITPSPTANLDGHTNQYQVTNLMQGQTYQIGTSGYDYTSDVTGTWIASDKPIALFAGASEARVPDASTWSDNPLVQEQLPVDSWGTQVLALSFAGRTNGDSYRVLAAYSNTVVTITGAVVTILNPGSPPYTVMITNETVVITNQAGQFYDIILDGPAEFRAGLPIQVAQFANGTGFDDLDNVGDPCEILLPPTGRYLQTNVVFSLPNDDLTGDFYIDKNYVNIIVPLAALTNTWVDGSTVDATNFVPIGTSGYYGAQLPLTNDGSGATTHIVTSSQPIGVQVYGFGYTDAYSYFGGLVK